MGVKGGWGMEREDRDGGGEEMGLECGRGRVVVDKRSSSSEGNISIYLRGR